MANYDTSADLIQDILFRAGEPTDGTSDFNDTAIRYLNRAYQAVWMGGGEFVSSMNETWWWLRTPGVFTLDVKVIGDVTATAGSDAITFTAAPTNSLEGFHIRIGTHPDVFKIESHTGGQAGATLDSTFTGTTGEVSFTAFRIDYTIESDAIKIIDPMTSSEGDRRIHMEGPAEFSAKWPLRDINEGFPTNFTIVNETKVRFNAYPDRTQRVDYVYLIEPADLDDDATEPLVPRQYRRILSDMATMWLHVDKNDSRASDAGQAARSGMQAMALENRKRWGQQTREVAIRPRITGRRKRVLRTESGVVL